jgi:hypothetical protein
VSAAVLSCDVLCCHNLIVSLIFSVQDDFPEVMCNRSTINKIFVFNMNAHWVHAALVLLA